jgi:hypothetical protein
MRELDRLDRRHGLGTLPTAHNTHRRRSLSPMVAGLGITAVVLAGLVAVGPGESLHSLRRTLGLGASHSSHTVEFEPGEGSFRFLLTQRGSDVPVGYDPCEPIEYVVNPDHGPPDWRELIEQAVADTEGASGLRFRYAGTSDERPFAPNRGGLVQDVRRPAVVGFASAEEIPDLGGIVAGVGGSRPAASARGDLYYVTGSVALDTDVFDHASTGEDRALLQAIVDHEFGHLVGLDHVSSSAELMSAANTGQTSYGPGDLEGLARLGAIACR